MVGADMKTVQRWLYEGRVPHRTRAIRVGHVLGVDPVWLWPTMGVPMSSADLVCVYTDIEDVPARLWQHMADAARMSVDIATAAAPVLPGEGMAESLAYHAKAGLPIRLVLGRDVSAPALAGVGLRVSDHSNVPAIFCFDAVMLVWLPGAAPGAANWGPVLRLVHNEENGLFGLYARTFDALWSAAKPT